MRLNFNHLKEIDESYITHLKFACSIGIGFLYRAIYFLVHGIVPIIQIPESFNLSATNRWLKKAEKHREKAQETI